MGLQSAMTTALTGLQAAESTIDVVGNNVANSNTVGFKESDVLFATQFFLTQTVGSAPNTTSGGTNPRQVGLGVNVSEIAPNFTQGTIQVSSNPLDLAIVGDGFFMVQGSGGSGQQFFTRNGQFKTNADNELTTVTGQRVLGYGISDDFVVNTNQIVPITIPFGGSAVAQETNNVTLSGTLPANSENVATQPGVIESTILTDNSVEIPTNFSVSDIDSVEAPSVSTATANAQGAGTGSVGQGTYQYRIAFYDPTAVTGNDEGPPSTAFPGTAVSIPLAGTDSIQLSNLPTSDNPSVFTMKRIYRIDTSAATPMYQKVAEIPEGDLTYTDTAAAGSGAELNANGLENSSYNYFVTFTGPGIESRPTEESATVSVAAAGGRIRLDNIPQPGASSVFTDIRIYRNLRGSPGTFYLVDEVPAGTTTYVDNKTDASINVAANVLDRHGPPITTALPLVNVATFDGTTYVDLFHVGTLQFTGAKGVQDGSNLATKELEITSTTTVLDLINFMQQAMGIQTTSPDSDHPLIGTPGGSLTGSSQIRFESNDGVQNAVHVKQSAFQLVDATGAIQSVPLEFTSDPTKPATGNGSTTEMVVYDSLGIPLTVRLTTSLESTTGGVTTYRWFATSADNQPATGVDTTVGTGILTFDSSGAFISASDTSVAIDRREVASSTPVSFDFDFSQLKALGRSDGNVQFLSQDGFAAGTLASFSITETGRIKGAYTNGVTRDLGQLLMARFANNGGLQQIGDNLWAQGVNSGEPIRDIPGSSGNGSLRAGTVELSNTDIGQNLIDLVLASTQYRGNTRVITTAQQLLDELLNLRR
jgi:flagellar hook protein FlgE